MLEAIKNISRKKAKKTEEPIPVTTAPIVKDKKTVGYRSGFESIESHTVEIPENITALAKAMVDNAMAEIAQAPKQSNVEELKNTLISKSNAVAQAERSLLMAKIQHMEAVAAMKEVQFQVNEAMLSNLIQSEKSSTILNKAEGYRSGLRIAYLESLGFNTKNCKRFKVEGKNITFDYINEAPVESDIDCQIE